MVKTLRQKAANIALVGIVALGCAGAATTTALVSAASEATIAHADTWKQSNGGWWYQTGTGYAKGWKQIGSTWYYFDNNGWMKTGWQSIGGKWYYFNGSGAMITGWRTIGGTWYYFNTSGAMVTGWQQIGGVWYYFNGSGAMVTGWQAIGGKWYYFNGSGAMISGQWIGNYYLNTDGTMATNTWIGDYHVDANGVWDQTRNSNSNNNNSSNSNNDNNSSNNSTNDNTDSVKQPLTNIIGWWDCHAMTATGSDGLVPVFPSMYSDNHVFFYSDGTMSLWIGGKYYKGVWEYSGAIEDFDLYITLVGGRYFVAAISLDDGTLLLRDDNDSDFVLIYER